MEQANRFKPRRDARSYHPLNPMPKKPLKIIAPDADQEPEQLPLSPAELAELAEDNDNLQEILDTCEALDLRGGHVKMFLRRKGDTEGNYVGKMSVEAFRKDGLDTLAAGPGGGEYVFKFCDSDGRFVKQRSLGIDPRFKGNLGEPPPASLPPPPVDFDKLAEKLKPAPVDNTGTTQIIVAMIDANQKTLTSMMTAIAAMNNRPPPEPAKPAPSAAESIMPVLLEMIRQKTDKTPLVETIEAMAALQSMQDGGGGKDDMIEKLVKNLGPPLLALMAARQAPPPPVMTVEPPPRLADTAGASTGAPAAGPATPPPPLPNEPKLAPFIPMLLNAARKGTPPAAYYEVIADNITDQQLDELIVELEKDSWFDSLFGSHTEVMAQKDWFEKLRAVFLADDVFVDDDGAEHTVRAKEKKA